MHCTSLSSQLASERGRGRPFCRRHRKGRKRQKRGLLLASSPPFFCFFIAFTLLCCPSLSSSLGLVSRRTDEGANGGHRPSVSATREGAAILAPGLGLASRPAPTSRRCFFLQPCLFFHFSSSAGFFFPPRYPPSMLASFCRLLLVCEGTLGKATLIRWKITPQPTPPSLTLFPSRGILAAKRSPARPARRTSPPNALPLSLGGGCSVFPGELLSRDPPF